MEDGGTLWFVGLDVSLVDANWAWCCAADVSLVDADWACCCAAEYLFNASKKENPGFWLAGDGGATGIIGIPKSFFISGFLSTDMSDNKS